MTYSVDWSDRSFRIHKYNIYKWPCTLKKGPGNYIFCRIDANSTWDPIYIGETGDLSESFYDHHKMECIAQAGATHIHTHNHKDVLARLDEKEDLIKTYYPMCNE